MFYENEQFPGLEPLAKNWRKVQDELAALEDERYIPWPERALYDGEGWKVFGLYAFGSKMEENCRRCPQTAALVEAVPGMMTAGFSRLAANSHIKPHEGYAGYAGHFLRAHLGLQVPPDCEIRVGDEIRGWTPGGLMVFDDSTEHEAWNRSDATRVVLLLDFRNPFRDEDAPGAALTPEVLALLEKEGLT
ncbi:MAG: aspartyl/asparaginyl beta-hydroxylase domain-containing protein [Rhodospirillaceae bacterium]|jgi:ornithine lipid ester-linked acyl 2-hydroxylase|nr:aspartyl/asparaginyl beta-hydroxylase domain-containing protein [Rhodospirillaceae bacterium]MBT5751994.1 aspartyl/asparaginyl beta-hydroxylase domain-containing protein [Rhodospirillaceae bacterium]